MENGVWNNVLLAATTSKRQFIMIPQAEEVLRQTKEYVQAWGI